MSIPGVDLKTEIAFDSGYRTADVDRTWTNVSEKVELAKGIGITYGRQDELGNADANEIDLVLDNTDGRFTWGRAAGPYHPNVRIGRPVRLTATIGGVNYVRFTGYVDDWPLEWPGGGDTYAAAPISGSSRLSRLGVDSPIIQTIDQAVETTNPAYYFPLTDPAQSTSGAELTGRSDPLARAQQIVTFGVGAEPDAAEKLGVDGRSAAKLSWSTVVGQEEWYGKLRVDLPTALTVSSSDGVSVGLFIKVTNPAAGTPSLDQATGVVLGLFNADPLLADAQSLRVLLDRVVGNSGSFAEVTYPTDLGDSGDVHHVLATLRLDGSGDVVCETYFDGDLAGSVTGGAGSVSTLNRLELTVPYGLGEWRDFLAGRVAVWDRVITATEAADIAEAGLGAYDDDTTDERLKRYAGWARIPAAEVVTTPSPVPLAGVDTTGAKIVDLMREVETAEAGVLHDDRQNRLTLRPRSARYNRAVDLTLNTNTQDLGADYAPKVDRQGFANVGKGSNSTGTVDVTYTDEASREEYGDAEYSVTTTSSDPDEPLMLIAAQINANSEPRPRAPSVTINVLDWISNPTTLAKVLGLDIGSKVSITNAPTQAASATANYFVEGYQETFGEASWFITLNLSPAWPADSVFILDDATYGELDSDNLLAL